MFRGSKIADSRLGRILLKEKIIKAVVLGDGSIVKEESIPKYEGASDQVKGGGLFAGLYDSKKAIKPKINFDNLIALLHSNFLHYRCINQKTADVVGQGFSISSGSGETDSGLEEQINEVKKFFEEPNPEESGQEFLKKFWTDYESLGNAYAEIVFDSISGQSKKPIAMWHIPAQTMRKCIGEKFYVQIVENKKTYFPRIGLSTAEIEVEIEKLKLDSSEVSEHFVFSFHNFSSWDLNYGIPDYYPVVSSILLDKFRTEYNIAFFENNAVPRYAVIVKGTELTVDVENVIKNYFQSGLKGQAHKTLVLSVGDKEVEITFKKLALDVQESSFRLLHEDDLYDIAIAHGVPPRWLGIAEPGKMGGSQEGRSQAMNYKANYVNPNQKLLSKKLTSLIIHSLFGYKDLNIEFNEIDLSDETNDAKVGDVYFKHGVLSINEFRKMYLGLPPIDAEAGNKHIILSKGEAIFLEDINKSEEVKREESDFAKQLLEQFSHHFEKKFEEIKSEVEKEREDDKSFLSKVLGVFKNEKAH